MPNFKTQHIVASLFRAPNKKSQNDRFVPTMNMQNSCPIWQDSAASVEAYLSSGIAEPSSFRLRSVLEVGAQCMASVKRA